MKIIRTKLYVHGDNVAGHAVHTGKDAQKALINSGVPTTYIAEKRKTMRDAIMCNCEFGQQYTREMQFNPLWDNKMQLVDGKYHPWESITDFFDYVRK